MAESAPSRPRRPSFTGGSGESEQLALADQRIARLEGQVEALKKAVRELADALHEELTAADARISDVEGTTEDLARIVTNQAKVVKKQEDRLKRGLTVIADALSALTVAPESHS